MTSSEPRLREDILRVLGFSVHHHLVLRFLTNKPEADCILRRRSRCAGIASMRKTVSHHAMRFTQPRRQTTSAWKALVSAPTRRPLRPGLVLSFPIGFLSSLSRHGHSGMLVEWRFVSSKSLLYKIRQLSTSLWAKIKAEIDIRR